MLKNILINEYKSLMNDIFNQYDDFLKKHNGYYNYLKIINHEIKAIKSAFNTLIKNRKNTFRSIFIDDYDSILHAIDKDLFEMIKSAFKNVSLLLDVKEI